MGEYIKCPKCGKYGIEVIGSEELACEYCEENEMREEDYL